LSSEKHFRYHRFITELSLLLIPIKESYSSSWVPQPHRKSLSALWLLWRANLCMIATRFGTSDESEQGFGQPRTAPHSPVILRCSFTKKASGMKTNSAIQKLNHIYNPSLFFSLTDPSCFLDYERQDRKIRHRRLGRRMGIIPARMCPAAQTYQKQRWSHRERSNQWY
jgi:hypothetical protein